MEENEIGEQLHTTLVKDIRAWQKSNGVTGTEHILVGCLHGLLLSAVELYFTESTVEALDAIIETTQKMKEKELSRGD